MGIDYSSWLSAAGGLGTVHPRESEGRTRWGGDRGTHVCHVSAFSRTPCLIQPPSLRVQEDRKVTQCGLESQHSPQRCPSHLRWPRAGDGRQLAPS